MFGEAFAEAGDVESGVKWYQAAVTAADGRASMKAAEQLGNLRSRLAWEIVDQAARHLDDMKKREKAGGQPAKAGADIKRARVAAESALAAAIKRADTLIADGLALLDKLMALEATMERASLIGSAYKRRALVNGAAGRRGPVDRDLESHGGQLRQSAGDRGEACASRHPLSRRQSAGRGSGAQRREAAVAEPRPGDSRHAREVPEGERARLLDASSAPSNWISTGRWRSGVLPALFPNWRRPTPMLTAEWNRPGCGRPYMTPPAWCCRVMQTGRRRKRRPQR